MLLAELSKQNFQIIQIFTFVAHEFENKPKMKDFKILHTYK